MLPGLMPQRDQHADRPCALDPQIARHDVGAIIMLCGERLNPLTGLPADELGPGQRSRNSTSGDPCEFRKLLDVLDAAHLLKGTIP